MNEDLIWNVLPEDRCRRIMALPAKAPLAPHKEDVKSIVMSSTLGSRLFSCACKQIVAEEVEAVVMAACRTMLAKETIDSAGLVKAMQDANDAVNRIACINLLPERRLASMVYRGLSFMVPVKSVGEQIEICLRAALRSEAVCSNQIGGLASGRGAREGCKP